MKTQFAYKSIILNFRGLAVGLALTLGISHQAAAASSALQFNSQTVMLNSGVDADATGKINVSMNGSAKGNNEQFNLSAAKLDPNTDYQLVAFIGSATNGTNIAVLRTGKKGALNITYVEKAQANSHSVKNILPTVLDPLCNVRELDIVNGSSQIVLSAVLTSPDKGKYVARRVMSNTGFLPAAMATLLLQAGSGSGSGSFHFNLQASGLTPNTDYHLTFNGNIFPTSTSDSKGKLSITAAPSGAPDVLDIQTVALADGTGVNIILISGGLGLPCSTAAQAGFNLGTAANFAVLGGAAVTSTGNTDVTGDLGVWAGASVTGIQGIVPGGPGVVHGKIHAGDATAQTAQGDLTTAFNDAAGRTLAPVDVANADLGGRTLVPGLYKSTGTLALTGTVTLDAQGDVNGVWIFQVASSLDTAPGSQVVLSGGAKASHVFWQVGTSAALATTTVFKGTIMADQSITLATGATLEGRALARIATVTMDSNMITIPAP
jgi:Ice-binding-like